MRHSHIDHADVGRSLATATCPEPMCPERMPQQRVFLHYVLTTCAFAICFKLMYSERYPNQYITKRCAYNINYCIYNNATMERTAIMNPCLPVALPVLLFFK